MRTARNALEQARKFARQNRLAAEIVLRTLKPEQEGGLAHQWARRVLADKTGRRSAA